VRHAILRHARPAVDHADQVFLAQAGEEINDEEGVALPVGQGPEEVTPRRCIWMLPSGIGCFAGDLSEQEQQLVWATQGVPDVDLFNQKLGGTAWRTKPSWYIVANNDRTVQPDLERFVAKRMGAHTYDLDSSHVPMLSHPDFVLDVIRTAAKSV
jgi:pimeloyl-ACP methyl ester carboxylesterase